MCPSASMLLSPSPLIPPTSPYRRSPPLTRWSPWSLPSSAPPHCFPPPPLSRSLPPTSLPMVMPYLPYTSYADTHGTMAPTLIAYIYTQTCWLKSYMHMYMYIGAFWIAYVLFKEGVLVSVYMSLTYEEFHCL